ncbi:caspase recruitment domain-containing protein 16 [Phyllostomus hastatus]|uniref:Caspase recruitment domain-containing protein 16 n=2 Tax=Phyllostomus discolor TaxID=89673 RepID=A0A7E6E075_9CHIR|nr:caspase recruitment domain-containing protein 16 [Phyllostomus discolor]XP_035884531.1 caspase recruitment domain-containing protein 16 [Phyllostomus discolor]XP_035884532.1 caspase recruitment domain-containing protein 16 [Phyllostomus discolor]XP_045696208.1 caspase recruitment domain-containing protein 16 [Phyllostomus hastatus]
MENADRFLKSKRRDFIQSVTTGTINGLLDGLLEERVLNQEEMEKVRRENYTAMDKARDLIDSVIRKGHQASQIFINQIVEVDPQLAHNLGLS